MILTYYTATTLIIIAYLLGSIPSAVWIGKNITASTSANTAAKTPARPTCCACWANARPCPFSDWTC